MSRRRRRPRSHVGRRGSGADTRTGAVPPGRRHRCRPKGAPEGAVTRPRSAGHRGCRCDSAHRAGFEDGPRAGVMTRVLDVHAHLFHSRWYPEAFARQLIGSLAAERQTPRREQVLLRALSDDTGASTIRVMDAAGIDHRIVLVLDWGLELGEAALPIRQIHEEILAICRSFPARLTGFAGVDPRRPDAADILTYACDELGARGLKLHPTSAGWTLQDERTERLVEIADERGLPVLVHVGATFEPLTDRHA